MSNLQYATVEDAKDLGTGTATNPTITLPNAHPISRIFIRERVTHATAITLTQDRIEVLADGSPLLAGLSGTDLRKLAKYDTGRDTDSTGAGGAEHIIEQVLMFGQFPGDPSMGLPAPLFQNVQLQVDASLSATPTAHDLDVVVEEILDASPKGMLIRKRSLTKTWDGAAGQENTRLPLGNVISAVYLDYADVENVDGAKLQLGVNNFSRRIFNIDRVVLEALNRQSYNFHDDTIPANAVAFDLAQAGRAGLDTKGLADVKLRVEGAASGTSGTCRLITEELISVA